MGTPRTSLLRQDRQRGLLAAALFLVAGSFPVESLEHSAPVYGVPVFDHASGMLPGHVSGLQGLPLHQAASVAQVYSALSEISQALHPHSALTNSSAKAARAVLHSVLAARPGAAAQGGRRIRRQLAFAVTLPPAVAPKLPPNRTVNASLIILAPNRTRRPDPLRNFHMYTGGWDFFSADYWASLAWSTVYGAAIGFVWVLVGLGLVTWVLFMCVCCHGRWDKLRDKGLRYDKRQLTLPMLFMVFGVVLECVGFGLLVAGAVKFTDTAHGLTDFTVHEVDRVSNVVLSVTPVLRRLADGSSPLNQSVGADMRTKLLNLADRAENIANTANRTATVAGSSVSKTLDTLQKILFCVGIITVGLVFVGLIFTCCRLVILSNVLTTMIWVTCFVTWVLVTVFLFVWLFGGDTTVSLVQIAAAPTDLSKFNVLVPCMDPTALDALSAFSRFAAYQTIVIVNATITQEAPFIFFLLRAPGGICSPFGPAPNYTYDPSACDSTCDPQHKYCKGKTIDIDTLAQRFAQFKCTSTNSAQCIVVSSLTSRVQEVTNTARQIVDAIQAILPFLERILRCAYITNLVTTLSHQVGELEYDTFILWMGFLFVSVGAIFFGACAPIYVYRAVRCYGSHAGDSEREPIKAAQSSESAALDSEGAHAPRSYSYEHSRPSAVWGAQPEQR